MRIDVDEERCQGHARCNLACPEVFELDDQGHVMISMAEVPVHLRKSVQEAISGCPERAIYVVGSDSAKAP